MLEQGDCLEVMRDIPDGTFTAIVTDPPYGLEFMGKGWDKVLPDGAIWREALRVLKPGGHALVFGGTRTYHRLACALEDAGFEIRDCLMWLYGQGFPKSMDVSKAIDKAAGVHGERGALKRGGERLAAQAPGGLRDGGGTWGDEVGRDPYTYIAGSEAAKRWDGYGTALKPAWEPISLARRPLAATVERNCREHGTGALNIDGCRIGYVSQNDKDSAVPQGRATSKKLAGDGGLGAGAGREGPRAEFTPKNKDGRWPANVVLDEAAAEQLDAQTGKTVSRKGKPRGSSKPGDGWGMTKTGAEYDDAGGASRFFYCAKASKSDRGAGNSHPTVKPVELMRWLVRLVKGPGENLILDPFAGSGTTGVAAQLEGVPFLLIEREAAYAAIIEERLRG